jgi:hypothetical protein
MKKSEVINLLLELLEAVCRVVGSLLTMLVDSFPALEKYVASFLFGAQTLVVKLANGL